MRNKNLLILAFITVVILVAASISSQNRAPQSVVSLSLLFPELKNQINSVTQLSVESAEGAININKQGDNWLITESGNYPARFDKVKQTVLALADLKQVSQKTSTPSLFSELDVADIHAENSKSRLLTLKDASGTTLASLIVGRDAGSGVYVRKPQTNETWQTSGKLDISSDVVAWVEQNLLDIADDRIFDTRLEHPDGKVVTITRAKGEKDFTVLDVPKDKQAKSGYFVNQIGTILSNLTIENVKARQGFTFPDTAIKTTIRTYDGLVATILTANVDGANVISLDFNVDEALLAAAAAAPAAETKPAEKEAIVIGEPAKDAAPKVIDVRKEVADLNSRVGSWVYTITSAKYGLLVKEPIDVIQDKPVEPAKTKEKKPG